MQGRMNSRGRGIFPARLIQLGLVTFALATTIGACSTTQELPAREARIVAPVEAMIIPPPGGPGIVRVVSAVFPNAVRQEIFLATQARTVGENKISVIQFIGKGGDGSDARLRDIPFTQVNLTEEALEAWPATGMAVSPYYVQNSYGPFGYAIGKPPNGDTCIYAWQRIAPTLRPSGATDRGAVTIRLQLCRLGASEQELVEIMYRLRLNSSVFPPAAAPAAIGRIAAPIRPIGAEGFAQVIEAPRPVRAPQPPARQPAAPVAAPIVNQPLPGAPIVPSPASVGSRASGPLVPRPPQTTVVVPPPPAQAQP
jgi:hypothetical protein